MLVAWGRKKVTFHEVHVNYMMHNQKKKFHCKLLYSFSNLVSQEDAISCAFINKKLQSFAIASKAGRFRLFKLTSDHSND